MLRPFPLLDRVFAQTHGPESIISLSQNGNTVTKNSQFRQPPNVSRPAFGKLSLLRN